MFFLCDEVATLHSAFEGKGWNRMSRRRSSPRVLALIGRDNLCTRRSTGMRQPASSPVLRNRIMGT